MIIAHIKVSGVTAACKRRSQIPARLVGGKIAIEYADPAWAELSKTAVFRGAVTRDVLNIGELVEIPQEVLAKVGADVYFGIEGRNADGTLVIPLIEAQLGKVMSSTDPSGDQSTTPELPVWQQILDLIGNLNDLTTEAKETLVEAINEAARKGGGSVDEKTVWEIVDEYLEKNPPVVEIPERLSQFENDTGFITRLVADLQNYYAKSQTYTKQEIDGKISAIPKFSINVVSALPTTGIRETTVYLLSTGSGSDLYTEYIYVDGEWEVLGSQRVDLTGYATEAWVEKKLEEHSGGNVELDTTLTQSGKAADAKAVGDKIAEITGISLVEPEDDDIPKVFITGVKPTTKDDVLAEMEYISKTERFHAYLTIKCQGSSSMNYAKKNFTVKLYSDEARETKQKKVFKDWNHESNKYVLKANWIDHSHARNIVSARLWDEVVKSRENYNELPEEMRNSPRSGAIDGFPVKLYYNGTYEGLYTWNIGKDAWMWGMDEDNPNHSLLSCGYNDNGVLLNKAGNFRALWSGVHEDNWDIEVGTQGTALTNSLNALISCVKDTDDETFKATIGNYLDINSALDYYLYFWANAGLDSLENNMLLATYDGVKWICGAYDMDSVWGLHYTGGSFIAVDFKCPDQYQGAYSLLWERITKLFIPELQARYAELRSGVLSYPNIVTHFEQFMDVIGSELYAEDLTIYTGIPSGSTNNIKQIRNYVRDRLAYVDGEVPNMSDEPTEPDIPDEPDNPEPTDIPCTGISLNVDTLTFDGEGTQTLTATVTPDGCTDAVTWESNDTNVATVSGGVVTAKANGSATITAKCGNYSASCTVNVSGIEVDYVNDWVNNVIAVQLTPGKALNGNGDVIDYSNTQTTEKYIKIPDVGVYEIQQMPTGARVVDLYAYNANKTSVGTLIKNKWLTRFEITDSSIKYIRITIYDARDADVIRFEKVNIIENPDESVSSSAEMLRGYVIDNTGVLTKRLGVCATGTYYPAEANATYTIDMGASVTYPAAFPYDADFKYLGTELVVKNGKFTTPANTAYLRWHGIGTPTNPTSIVKN